VSFSLSSYALIPFLTLLQASIFAVLLLLRGWREEQRSDCWLALLLVLFGLSGVPYLLGMAGINYLWDEWPFYPWQYFGLAVPPTIYLFLHSLVNTDFRWQPRLLWHYAPYLVNFVYHLSVGLQGADFAEKWQREVDSPYLIFVGVEAVELVQHVVYLLLSLRLYRQYRQWIEREFSDLGKVEYAWFRGFLFVFALKTVEVWAFSAYYLCVGEQYDKLWWGYFSDTVMVYFLSIFGYAQQPVRGGVRFSVRVVNRPFPAEQNDEMTADEMTVSTARDLDLETWKTRVLDFFDRERPYLRPELTLSELAAQMRTNHSVLSQVINAGFGVNFNDFVNGYRVAAFQEKIRLPENAHLTLLAVALDCGFNSKATFNRAFRKLAGMSPKEFVEQKTT